MWQLVESLHGRATVIAAYAAESQTAQGIGAIQRAAKSEGELKYVLRRLCSRERLHPDPGA